MCFSSGFLGREAIVESIDIDDSLREIIYEGTMTHLPILVGFGVKGNGFRLKSDAKSASFFPYPFTFYLKPTLVLTHLHRHLREINYSSFRNAAIEKVTFGLTTVQEIKRVLPRSALFDNKNNVWRSHLVTT